MLRLSAVCRLLYDGGMLQWNGLVGQERRQAGYAVLGRQKAATSVVMEYAERANQQAA